MLKLHYFFLLPIAPLACEMRGQPNAVQDMHELASLQRNWISPFAKRNVDAQAVARVKGLSDRGFERLMADFDRLLGIDRTGARSWLPAMWAKIRIVDAVKRSFQELRATSADEPFSYENFRKVAKELEDLTASTLAEREYDVGPLRPGLAAVPSLSDSRQASAGLMHRTALIRGAPVS